MDALIPQRILRELVRGSLEEQISSVSEAVLGSASRFGAEPSQVRVVATFPQHAIVMSGDGDFHRATLKKLDQGGMAVVESEEIDVPALRTMDERLGFFGTVAGEAVTSLLEGDFATARTRIRELTEGASLLKEADPLDEMREYLGAVCDPERKWRQVYEANRGSVHRLIWGASGTAHRDSPVSKYLDLYGGEMVEDATGYHTAVSMDLGLLGEKLTTLWDRYQQDFGEYDQMDSGYESLAIAGTKQNFREFAEDYGKELAAICRMVEHASADEDVETVRARAMAYDHVARHYPSLEIACRLISRTVSDLKGK